MVLPVQSWALWGAVTGGLTGGISSEISGGSFWDGAKMGAIFGGIGGGIGGYFSAKAQGLNPWTGKALSAPESQFNYNFTPDANGDNVKMYRGTTGSEGKGGPLFMTDNPEYAATYVQNGGQVIEVTIPRSTFLQMQFDRTLIKFNGINYSTGTGGTEFMINKTDVINKLLLNSKTY